MTRRGSALLFGGGVGHSAGIVADGLAPIAGALGLDVRVTDDLELGASVARSDCPDVIVFSALRWRMLDARYDDLRQEWAYSPSPEVRSLLREWVASGRPLLALHTATICFDDWNEWTQLLGGSWEWGKSSHPAVGPVKVAPVGDHPIVNGMSEFYVTDECYAGLNVEPTSTVIATSQHDDTIHPSAWVQDNDNARVVYSALGHDGRSFEEPGHVEFLGRCFSWLLAGS